ncbi:MAG: GNAT family N-acetyltransferase [Gammaproteobacteria bacterium]|nr:GNAT family N-acetyltransferase [Gammaproteobacteria bacterium]NIR81647.1 GNAT family N-acetyltransferase [Gammaproteobacteria bacterium]NIR88198.1 GNAT family N-acetyltransferase [Gammaproteobacteria bacterium]NIU02759.1 GNAT family N-acetyltransferase [Gammaproteobacteria bacterium]NIV73358.1 GNAT family N-acetyltransferase [Gammaproteobacteria bacterium]
MDHRKTHASSPASAHAPADYAPRVSESAPAEAGEVRPDIPEVTIETLARTFFREAASYGFRQLDYVRFVNLLLDMATRGSPETSPSRESDSRGNGSERARDSAVGLPLAGERVRIRAFDADDLTLLERWLRDAHGRYFLLSRTTSRQSRIRELVESRRNIIGIITLPDGTPIGSVAFLDYDPVQRKAELRKLIGESAWRGRGFAKEASRLWIQYGLRSLRLRKIYLNTLNTNLPNIRLNEDLGFQVEGILRNELCVDGEYHDVLRMGLWHGP